MNRHVSGSLLPSNEPRILQPVETPFGVLQVRVIAELDTHGLFHKHDRGESLLATHGNGYGCRVLIERMVRLLIASGADVNARGDFGRTPLHFAVWDGGIEAIEIVQILLAAGADIHAADDRLHENALGFALREYKDDLEPAIRLFRARGAAEPATASELGGQ